MTPVPTDVTERPTERLVGLIRSRRLQPPLNLEPATTYEVVTRQMVEDLIREITAVRQRVDSLFYLVIAAIAGNVLLRFFG